MWYLEYAYKPNVGSIFVDGKFKLDGLTKLEDREQALKDAQILFEENMKRGYRAGVKKPLMLVWREDI